MKKLVLLVTLMLTLSVSKHSTAWNRFGHLAISDISCESMTQTQRNNLDTMLNSLIAKLSITDKRIYNKQPYSSCKLARLAILPDYWRNLTLQQILQSVGNDDQTILEKIDNKKTADWHYRNHKYDIGKLDYIVNQLITNIKKSKDPVAKSIAVIFVAHLLEDAHQPLHTTSRPVNLKLNLLDNGGNLYCLQTIKPGAKCHYSLHKYWDNGGGFLVNPKSLKTLEKNIAAVYPQKSFKATASNLNPNLWLDESSSFENFVYKTPPGKMPNKSYKAQTQKITQQRMALAGYRLSNLLNELLIENK